MTRRPVLLVLRALGLGDLLCGFPALRALHAAFPRHRMMLAAPSALGPLVLASGAVDDMVPVGPLQPMPPATPRPDVAVNLHGRGPESHRVLIATRPRRLIAFARPDLGVGGPRWRPDEHEVARWCRMLHEHGIPADPSRLELRVEPDPALGGVTVVHPGAAAPARRWPAARFAAVARAVSEAGGRVVVTGSAAEGELARRVVEAAGLGADALLAGRTGLLELARVVAAARLVVSGDTGVAHLAAATGTPSVTLYGPVSPARWGLPQLPRHRSLWTGVDGREAEGGAPHPGLMAIEVDSVLREITALRDAGLVAA